MTGVSIVITNDAKKIIWCNDDFLEMTGYRRSELMGNSPGQILQGEGTEQDIVEKLRKAFKEKIPVSATLTNYHKDGHSYPCSICIHPIFGVDDSKELTGFIAFEIDESKSHLKASDLLKIKYSSTQIPREVKLSIISGIENQINEKFYLNGVTIKELSDSIKTNPRYLSQVIHEEYGKHFSSWINSFRIDEAKRLFREGVLQSLTIEGVSAEVGFKSYSSFYSAFRAIEGRSPQDWVETNLRED